MSSSLAIRAQGLGKRYRLGAAQTRHDSLRDLLADGVRSLLRRDTAAQGAARDFWALKDASFDIAHGENVGIIGLNGAGKSTLLKILSRITEPTAGHARIEGRIGALLEVGTGFHGELTGRENVFLYGSILGMGKEEVRRKFDAIVDFSGIQEFIDTPVKRYSSGMYVRLAFAVAAHLEPEILLLDEVLAVGDLAFQRKCMNFAKDLQTKNATILFVSHNMFSIKTMCQRVIYLQKGRVLFDGSTDKGIEIYENDSRLAPLAWASTREGPRPVTIADAVTLDDGGQPKTVFEFGDRVRLRLRYQVDSPVNQPNFIVAFVRSDGIACCSYSTAVDRASPASIDGEGVVELLTPPLKLVAEVYTVHILVRDSGFTRLLCAQNGPTFHVRHELFDLHFGVYHEDAEWQFAAGGPATTAADHRPAEKAPALGRSS
jgi:lipopolysaccharide transport system ATP-binding protein